MTQQEFDRLYCKKLNPQQLQAVHSVDGPVLLLAVPGSGKTTVLVTRLGYMVLCHGIEPRQILTMTYTLAATAQMRQRFAESFGAQYARGMEFCTINSLASQIINHYSRCHGTKPVFPLIDNENSARIIIQIYQDINHEYPTDSVIKDIRTAITYIKNMMLSPEEIETLDLGLDNLDKIYAAYCAALREQQFMDFDDQLSYALTILRRYGDVLEHFQNRFPYICVDESQDTSGIQHEIIKLLAAKYGNIFMVGDEDQSIYGFRAAYPEALLNFEKDYPNAKLLLMEQNYRSTREIVAAADAFIAKNKNRHPKRIKATRDSGCQIQLIEAESREVQFDYLFEVARLCREETAFLYRNNDSALPLIDLFHRRGLSYNCKKFEDSFFTHRVVSDIRDIITFAHEPKNAEVFQRIYYKLGSPISRKAADYACNESQRLGKNILDALMLFPEYSQFNRDFISTVNATLCDIAEGSAEKAIMRIWKSLKYSAYVAMNGLDAGKYDILCLLAKREKTPLDFLQRLDTLRQLLREHENSSDTPLILSTIHSSKGLEYERVYLMDMFDGILPSKNKSELKDEEDALQYEEDRRVFYVGMTRAKNELYVFNCCNNAGEFCEELTAMIPDEAVDEDDVFAPIRTRLLGKGYCHREKGKGLISAQCGDRLLVSYPGQEPELYSLAQMMEQRDMRITYLSGKKPVQEAAPPPPKPEIKLSIGTKLLHKSFGEGVVLSVRNDIASILFSNEHGTKRIILSTGFKNGILSAVDED